MRDCLDTADANRNRYDSYRVGEGVVIKRGWEVEMGLLPGAGRVRDRHGVCGHRRGRRRQSER